MTIGPEDRNYIQSWGSPGPVRELEISPAYDLSGLLPYPAKRVVINDYLPDGMMYVTPGEVIISMYGWNKLVWWIQMKNQCNVDVRRIIEREMGDVLAWLRGAGRDV